MSFSTVSFSCKKCDARSSKARISDARTVNVGYNVRVGSENLVNFLFVLARNEYGVLSLYSLLDLVYIIGRHEQRNSD